MGSRESWELVVGLETHVQLFTASKMFCGCSTDYDGAEPNTHVCPICLGLPGSLPAPNAAAIEFAVRTGLALGCTIAEQTHFDRKNYHYPDLPKGYQISQYDEPLCRDGRFDVLDDDGVGFSVGIERVHLEEDTGKSTHVSRASLVDYNRSGVPLVEIVTRPDMRSPEEAKAFLESLRQLLRWIGVSTGNMEAGALRADVNVSVRPKGTSALGVKVELKNLNSFASVKAALEYERERLIGLLEAGQPVLHETRGWLEAEGRSAAQRTKERAEDYRYFPEPDLPPLRLDSAWAKAIGEALPELPVSRRRRLVSEYMIADEPARLLTRDAATADYFEAAVAEAAVAGVAVTELAGSGRPDEAQEGEAQVLATWITGPIFGHMRSSGAEIQDVAATLPPASLAELARLAHDETLTLGAAKALLERILAERPADSPKEIVEKEGLGQISETSALDAVVDQVLDASPEAVADYCGGKSTAIGFLIGRVMRATRGQANPNLVRQMLQQALDVRCGAAGLSDQ